MSEYHPLVGKFSCTEVPKQLADEPGDLRPFSRAERIQVDLGDGLEIGVLGRPDSQDTLPVKPPDQDPRQRLPRTGGGGPYPGGTGCAGALPPGAGLRRRRVAGADGAAGRGQGAEAPTQRAGSRNPRQGHEMRRASAIGGSEPRDRPCPG